MNKQRGTFYIRKKEWLIQIFKTQEDATVSPHIISPIQEFCSSQWNRKIGIKLENKSVKKISVIDEGTVTKNVKQEKGVVYVELRKIFNWNVVIYGTFKQAKKGYYFTRIKKKNWNLTGINLRRGELRKIRLIDEGVVK